MKILLSGSVAFDYLMSFPGYFRDHFLPDRLDCISLSFLVESMSKMPGGIAPNIAYTMALLGEHPRLWAAVGEDFEEYRRFLEERGVDTSGAQTIPGVFTASFFVNTDRSNAQIASFFPGAMAHATQLSMHRLEDDPPDLVVVSPNDPGAMNLYVQECQELGIPYIYDPSQQIVRLSAEEVETGLRGALALFVNDYERALIQNLTGKPVETVLQNSPAAFVVVTMGEKGAEIHTQQGLRQIPCIPPENIEDPTGVGDAFRGGFLTGYSHHFNLELCARMGALAATYCLEQHGAQGHVFTSAQFVERFRRNFEDGGVLDELLPD